MCCFYRIIDVVMVGISDMTWIRIRSQKNQITPIIIPDYTNLFDLSGYQYHKICGENLFLVVWHALDISSTLLRFRKKNIVFLFTFFVFVWYSIVGSYESLFVSWDSLFQQITNLAHIRQFTSLKKSPKSIVYIKMFIVRSQLFDTFH